MMPSSNALNPWQHEQSLRIALDAMPVGVSWATLADQKIVYMNRAFTEIFGYVVGDFESISDWIGKYPILSDRTMAGGRWAQYFQDPDGANFPIEPMELSITCKDGTVKTILHSGVILPLAGWALATFIDISEQKRNILLLQDAEKRATQNEAISRTLLGQSQEMIVLSYFDGSQRFVSPAVQQITGLTPTEYLATPVRELVHPDDLGAMAQAVLDVAHGTSSSVYRGRVKHKDGEYRWVETLLRSCVDPDSKETVGYVATIRDIGEQKKQEDLLALENRRLSEDASQDELTGIANRRLFNRTLVREVRRQTRNTSAIALLMLDVDNFKEYNDHYGHLPGDLCLRQVAATLKRTLQRDSDLVARFGGEEFVILLPMTDCAGARHLASAILEAIRSLAIPHTGTARGILTVSIGVACWPTGNPTDPKRLLQYADTALYRAKSAGRDTFSVIHCETESAA
jgi:diguanylate cyclase (GGDEF)-like protein/PAS domain S-box-containing protein